MTSKTYMRFAALMVVGVLHASIAGASPVAFTDQAAFNAATAGLSGMNTLDFESLPVGSLSVGPFQGISFAFTIGSGFAPNVIDAFDTTSGTHSLGTNGDDTFVAGDSFAMSFLNPTNAIGLYVIAGTDLFAGDFTLTTNTGGTVQNAAIPQMTLADTGKVFFLGLYDPVQAFSSATLSSTNVGADFLFNVDDIRGQFDAGDPTTPTPAPVPEPGTLLLLGTGLYAGLRRWRQARIAM
jgi:hypothetical protein